MHAGQEVTSFGQSKNHHLFGFQISKSKISQIIINLYLYTQKRWLRTDSPRVPHTKIFSVDPNIPELQYVLQNIFMFMNLTYLEFSDNTYETGMVRNLRWSWISFFSNQYTN